EGERGNDATWQWPSGMAMNWPQTRERRSPGMVPAGWRGCHFVICGSKQKILGRRILANMPRDERTNDDCENCFGDGGRNWGRPRRGDRAGEGGLQPGARRAAQGD